MEEDPTVAGPTGRNKIASKGRGLFKSFRKIESLSSRVQKEPFVKKFFFFCIIKNVFLQVSQPNTLSFWFEFEFTVSLPQLLFSTLDEHYTV